MNKNSLRHAPSYFDRYIQLVDDIALDDAFKASLDRLEQFEWSLCEKIGANTYAPGKWTIQDILQHIVDWERIMTYRALGFARQVLPSAPGHDEDNMAIEARADQRDLSQIIEEMKILRMSTQLFFRSLDDEQILRTGISYQSELSALALGYTILGHETHHFNIIRDRYFPLLSQ